MEITTRLACSTTTAEHYTELGTALSERLPGTSAAFAAGEIDYPKAWRIATATGGFSDAVVAEVEAKAVQIAGRYAPARFATEIDALLISTAPDEYAELRKDAEKWQRRIRRRGSAPGAASKLTYHPRKPPRCGNASARSPPPSAPTIPLQTAPPRRCLPRHRAGEDHLTCTCGRPDCTADPNARRRKPLVQITIDAAALLGLRSEPAFLPGHGPIDPELARRIAHDSHWQGMLIELLDLAVAAGIFTAEQASSARTPQSHPEATFEREPAPSTDAEPTESDTQADTEPAPAADPGPDIEPAPATTAEPIDLDAEINTEPDAETAPVTRTEPAAVTSPCPPADSPPSPPPPTSPPT